MTKKRRTLKMSSVAIPRVTKRPMEHSNFGIDKAKNGFVATVSGHIPIRSKSKDEMTQDYKYFTDKYICKSKVAAKEILKRAIR